jgi:hypothetical protein
VRTISPRSPVGTTAPLLCSTSPTRLRGGWTRRRHFRPLTPSGEVIDIRQYATKIPPLRGLIESCEIPDLVSEGCGEIIDGILELPGHVALDVVVLPRVPRHAGLTAVIGQSPAFLESPSKTITEVDPLIPRQRVGAREVVGDVVGEVGYDSGVAEVGVGLTPETLGGDGRGAVGIGGRGRCGGHQGV